MATPPPPWLMTSFMNGPYTMTPLSRYFLYRWRNLDRHIKCFSWLNSVIPFLELGLVSNGRYENCIHSTIEFELKADFDFLINMALFVNIKKTSCTNLLTDGQTGKNLTSKDSFRVYARNLKSTCTMEFWVDHPVGESSYD